jgi:hypothetical protein
MEISKGMVDYYLGKITIHWFDTNDLPAENLEDYYEKAKYIEDIAVENNDLKPLKIGFDYFLCNKELDLEDHGYSYSWTDQEVRDIIKYLISIIYQNHLTDCDCLKNHHLLNTTINDWWEMRREQGLHPISDEN